MANPLKILTDLVVSGSTSTSGSLTVGGNGGLTVANGLTVTAGSVSLPATSVANAALQGSGQVTIGSTAVALGATETSLAGLTTVDTTNLEVSSIKAKDGSAAATIADSTGVVTITSLTASTIDINGGAIDGATIGESSQASGKFTTISGSGNAQVGGTLTVAGVSTLTGDVTFGGNIVADANENKSIFAAVTSNTITIGASGATVSIPGTASVGGNLSITGNLTVNGTTTTVSSQNVTIKDKNIILAVPDGGAAATDSGADEGGITLSGSTNKTFQWSNGSDSWTSSEHLDLASGKTFKIATVDVVKQTTFSQEVDNGAFTLDITGSQLVSGSSTAYVGVGAASAAGFGSLGDAVIVKGDVAVVRGGNIGLKLEASGSNEQGGITIAAYGTNETITLTGSAGVITLEDLVGLASSVTAEEYYNVRSVVSGTKQSSPDTVTFTLSETPGLNASAQGQGGATPTGIAMTGMSASSGEGAAVLIQRLGGMSFDVAVRDVSAQVWSNDLVSVQLTASQVSTVWYPQIIVTAPSLATNSQIRLIAVNETKNVI